MDNGYFISFILAFRCRNVYNERQFCFPQDMPFRSLCVHAPRARVWDISISLNCVVITFFLLIVFQFLRDFKYNEYIDIDRRLEVTKRRRQNRLMSTSVPLREVILRIRRGIPLSKKYVIRELGSPHWTQDIGHSFSQYGPTQGGE